MKKKKSVKNIKKQRPNVTEYINSFKKLDKRFTYSVLLDLLFFMIFALFAWVSNIFLYGFLENVPKMNEYFISTYEGIESVAHDSAVTGSVVGKVFLIFALFLIASFIAWGVTRYVIWSVIRKKKMSIKHALKFTGITFLWELIFVVPLIAILLLVTALLGDSLFVNELASLTHLLVIFILFIFYLYFSTLFYYKTIGSMKCKSLWHALKLGVLKIRCLGKPTLFIILTLVALGIFSITFKILPASLITILSIILWFLFMAWVRFYFLAVFEKNKI